MSLSGGRGFIVSLFSAFTCSSNDAEDVYGYHITLLDSHNISYGVRYRYLTVPGHSDSCLHGPSYLAYGICILRPFY